MDEGWIQQVEHAIDTFEEDDRLIELKVRNSEFFHSFRIRRFSPRLLAALLR